LPLIFLLWANLHAGFAAGLALFGFLILGNWWQNHKNKNPQSQNFEITIFLISFAVTLINPYGLQLYREIFSVLLSSDTAKYIAEWQTPLAFGSLYLEIFMAAVLFLLIKNYKKYPLSIFLAAAVFSLAFLKSIRMMLPFLVIAMPLAVSGIEFVKQDIFAARSKKPFSPKQISLIKIAGWTILVVVLVFFNWELTHYQFFPMPEKAALFLQKYLEQNKTAHNVLNDYAWGGYLLWKIPDLRVFIDGRMDHWTDQNGNSAMKDYVKIFSVGDSADWQGILKKWQITDIIMPNPDTSKDDGALSQWLTITLQNHFSDNGAINQFLFPASTQDKRKEIETTLLQNGWKTIYQDQIAVILSCGNCGY